jgi:hypothetical protein
MKTDQFVQIFYDWVRWHKKCVELKGDYVGKKLNWFERLTSKTFVILPSHKKFAQTDQFSCEILHSLRLVLIHLNCQTSFPVRRIWCRGKRQFLRKFSQSGIGFLDRIITTNETWFHYYDPETKQQSSQWKNVDSPWPKKVKVTNV